MNADLIFLGGTVRTMDEARPVAGAVAVVDGRIAAFADRPVMLEASDHHCAWLNREALRRAGITADTPDPPASTIPRRADGTPIGTLVEWGAVELVKRQLEPPTEPARRRGLASAG